MNEAIVKREGQEVAASSLMSEMMNDAGDSTPRGADVATPFLVILQKTSPQVEEGNGQHIPGAKPGMVLNTVTKRLYDTSVTPQRPDPPGIVGYSCGYVKLAVEWVPRDEGGGFVAQHAMDSEFLTKCKPSQDGSRRLESPQGNDVIETAYHHFMAVNDSVFEHAVIGMTSTALKASRKWNTFVEMSTVKTEKGSFKPPEYATKFCLRTVQAKNDKGTWWTWDVQPIGLCQDAAEYAAAKAHFAAVKQGMVKVTAPPVDDAQEQPSEKVPF